MKAQVMCKICENEFDFDKVCYIGNYDYEDIKDCPVNICKSCSNQIMKRRWEFQHTKE